MIRTVASVVALAAVVVRAQDFVVDTLSQCTSAAINFPAATPPYYVAVLPAENPCESDAIVEFQNIYETSINYYANLNQGTGVMVYVEDANGAEFWSNTVWVGGGDSSCLGGVDNYVPPVAEFVAPVDNYVPPANNEVEQEEQPVVDDVPTVPETPTSTGSGAAYTPPASSAKDEEEEEENVDVPNNVAPPTNPSGDDGSEITEQPISDGDGGADSSVGATTLNVAAAMGALLVSSLALF